jgi:CheY-like chemotaxis protein
MGKGKPITILLVEDDPAHAEIVRRNLDSFRVANRIIHVQDGQAALDYLFQRNSYADTQANPRPDLILLDLRLPVVDGMEVLRQIKEDEALKRLPTVVLTTSSAETDMVNAYAHGAGSYLVKPVDFDKFTNLMEAFGFYWLAWNRFPDEARGEAQWPPPPRSS